MKYGLDDDGVFRIEAPILPTFEDAAINAAINKQSSLQENERSSATRERERVICLRWVNLPSTGWPWTSAWREKY